MNSRVGNILPFLLAGIGFAAFAALLIHESAAYRASVVEWATRDLNARAELAAEALAEAPATGDFATIRAFGDECRQAGLRFTLFSPPGGIMYDALGGKDNDLSVTRSTKGGYRIRLSIPAEKVLEPSRRTFTGLVLAGLAGASGLLLVFLFTSRLQRHNRELAAEHERQLKMLEEMRKVEEFRRTFIADVSHEIKTPLTGILGAVDMLSSSVSDADRAALLAMLKRESTRLNSLALDIISLSRLETASAFNPLPADFADILSSAVDRTRIAAEQAGISLIISTTPIEGECEAALVEQAVANLVMNAIRHSGAKEIMASLAQSGEDAVFTVEDHGCGIPVEHREKIFDRFHRVAADRASETGGSGLGLAIVRGIANLHKGNVRLETPSEGGCRFVFSIPLKQNNEKKGNQI